MNGHQTFVHLAPEDVDDALAEITGGEIEEYVVGSGEGKRQVGMRQRDALKLGYDV